ncbi:MAG: DUF3164 family protein [Desulfobulbaceae bacterium]|nr:DUF3164 family protein [Desulfobulbaceae bacterium]
MTTASIPEGFRQDSMGRLVPEAMVKEIDKLRDDLVSDLVRRARDTSSALYAFKTRAFAEIESFVELSAAEYDQAYGGTKGNINLVSYDGRYKVQRAVADHFEFDERLQVAKSLIDACINDWTDETRPEVQMLINDAFQVDKKGNVSTKRIMSLRKFNIEDERWTKAMAAINDSLTVVGSRVYLRVYERIEGTDQWKQIPLDLASV